MNLQPTYRCANLDMVLPDGFAVVHGIKGSDFVDAHGRHFEEASNLVHNADAGEAVLALAEIEKGHDGGLFVLRRVTLQDFLDEGEVLGGEFEGDGGIVCRLISVLEKDILRSANCPLERTLR